MKVPHYAEYYYLSEKSVKALADNDIEHLFRYLGLSEAYILSHALKMAEYRDKPYYVHFIEFENKRVFLEADDSGAYLTKHNYLMALIDLERNGLISCGWLVTYPDIHADAWVRKLEPDIDHYKKQMEWDLKR